MGRELQRQLWNVAWGSSAAQQWFCGAAWKNRDWLGKNMDSEMRSVTWEEVAV